MQQDNDSLIKKCFGKFLFASVLGTFGANVSIVVDNMIAGKLLGAKALAAMSLVNPVFFFFSGIGILLCAGGAAIASIYIGENNHSRSKQVFTLTVLLVAVTAGAASLVGSRFLPELVGFITEDATLFPLALDYLKALVPGGFAIVLVYLPFYFFRIDGRANLGIVLFLVMAAADIILDLFFVKVLHMGMFGMALATVLSSLLATMAVLPFFFSRVSTLRLVPVQNVTKLLKQILAYGSPAALNNLYSLIRVFCLNLIFLSAGGSIFVASFAFVNSVNVVAQAFISGIAGSVPPLVGIFKGERDFKSIKVVLWIANRLGVGYMIAFALVCSLLAEPLTGLFGITGEESIAAASMALRIMAASLVVAIVNMVFIYYYNVIGRIWLSNLITLCRGLVFVLPLAVLLSSVEGGKWIWLSFPLSEVFTLLTVMVLSKLYVFRHSELLPVCLLERGDEAENQYSFSVANNLESILESSDKISGFCQQIKLDAQKTMVISLSIEEILILIGKYGLNHKEKEFIDIRIVQNKESIIMRFRCGGSFFNPIDFYKKAVEKNAPEIEECLGIKILLKLVTSMDYTTNLGLNNIIICI